MSTTQRELLPYRHEHEVIEFEHLGFCYVAGLGRFADGRLAEVFLGANKIGTGLDTAAKDSAIVCSLALQHGTPLETLRRALTRNADGTASGPLGTLLDRITAKAAP